MGDFAEGGEIFIFLSFFFVVVRTLRAVRFCTAWQTSLTFSIKNETAAAVIFVLGTSSLSTEKAPANPEPTG